MKAILEFDLTNIDERMEHLRCLRSLDMALFIWDIQHRLIADIKEEKLSRIQIMKRLEDRLFRLNFDIEEIAG